MILEYIIIAWFLMWTTLSVPSSLSTLVKQVICAVILVLLIVVIVAPRLIIR